MSKEKEAVSLNISGLSCDNQECDYQNDAKFEEFKDWLDKPCPKCGEVLLTEQDYENTLMIVEMAKMFNNMSEELFEKMTDGMKDKVNEENILEKYGIPSDTEAITVKLNIHNGVSIDSVTASKKE